MGCGSDDGLSSPGAFPYSEDDGSRSHSELQAKLARIEKTLFVWQSVVPLKRKGRSRPPTAHELTHNPSRGRVRFARFRQKRKGRSRPPAAAESVLREFVISCVSTGTTTCGYRSNDSKCGIEHNSGLPRVTRRAYSNGISTSV
jgi:hypothetical protein